MTTFSFAKVVRDILAYCDSHARVSNTFYENEYNMEGSTEADYPAVIIYREPSVMNRGENIFSLRIHVVDQTQENESDRLDVDSKTYSILSDIRANFSLAKTAQYSVGEAITNEPITHEKNDRIRGFAATFDFSVVGNADGCNYPE